MNYQIELEKILQGIQISVDKGQIPPKLLLHSCCAPCSSYVIEYLSQHMPITVFYYNPNISPSDEYEKRANEQRRLIETMETKYKVDFLLGDYESERFFELAKGLEKEPECGERCRRCYILRMNETAKLAKKLEYDFFATTLTISPMKSAQKLNEIGIKIQEELSVAYLQSDFKKKNGYKRSTELSHEYGLYRQDFCGCIFSKINKKDRGE